MSRRPDQYRDIQATELFCPTCKRATRVRERLLLVLPNGNLYDYACTQCGASLGKRDEPVAGNFARQGVVTTPGLRRKG
jgi:hypothetical protein